jgi:hypothetical protein
MKRLLPRRPLRTQRKNESKNGQKEMRVKTTNRGVER